MSDNKKDNKTTHTVFVVDDKKFNVEEDFMLEAKVIKKSFRQIQSMLTLIFFMSWVACFGITYYIIENFNLVRFLMVTLISIIMPFIVYKVIQAGKNEQK